MPPLYSSIHSKRTVYRIALVKIYLIIFKIIRKNRISKKQKNNFLLIRVLNPCAKPLYKPDLNHI